jgi:hypothetical protein
MFEAGRNQTHFELSSSPRTFRPVNDHDGLLSSSRSGRTAVSLLSPSSPCLPIASPPILHRWRLRTFTALLQMRAIRHCDFRDRSTIDDDPPPNLQEQETHRLFALAVSSTPSHRLSPDFAAMARPPVPPRCINLQSPPAFAMFMCHRSASQHPRAKDSPSLCSSLR